jgi:hypothetical protein
VTVQQRAFVAAWLAGAAGIVAAGFAANPAAHPLPGAAAGAPYPLDGVAAVAGLWTAQLAATGALLAVRPRPLALPRAWLAAALGVAGALLGVVGSLHAPWHWMVFAWGSIVLAPVLAGVALRRSWRSVLARPAR